jgi:hypothetical protein
MAGVTSERRRRALSARALGALAVVGVVVAFSLSSTLAKEAQTPGVFIAFWRLVIVSVVWNVYLWCTGRRVTMRDVRQALLPGIFFGLNLGAVAFLWAPALAGVWALGWTITSAIGVDVERQYAVFGSSGAVAVTLVTMVLPFALARANARSAS